VAREVAAAAGWDWHNYSLPGDWPQHMQHVLPTTLGWSDSNLEIIRLCQVLWTHQEKSQRWRLLLGGGGHEHWSGRQWLHAPLTVGKSTPIDLDQLIHVAILKGLPSPIFAADPTPSIRDHIRDHFQAYGAPYANEINAVKYNVLWANKQTGHHGAYSGSAERFLTLVMPAFFKAVFNVAISIDPQYRNRHRLVRAMIERLNPRVAAINTHMGSPAQQMRLSNLHRFAPYYKTLGRKAIATLSRRYLHRSFLAPAPVFNDRVTAARRTLLDRLNQEAPFVHANLRSGSLYNPEQLDAFLRRAYNPDFTQTDLLGRVITTELAMRAVESGGASATKVATVYAQEHG
jgi:hypothetical protein